MIKNIGLIIVLSIVFVTAFAVTSIILQSRGTLKLIGLKAYSDPAGTIEIDEVNWGLIDEGEVIDFSFYIKAGTVPVTLNMTTDNYIPIEAQQYLNLTWNYISNTTIQANSITSLTLTLTVTETAWSFIDVIFNQPSFIFDIIISAEEV